MSESKVTGIYAKVSLIKSKLSQIEIKKSGQNKFAGYKYHELTDFLKELTILQSEHGVDDTIVIDREQGCSITLTDTEDGSSKTVTVPYVEAEMLAKGGAKSQVDAIQRIGATITYQRRYLYMTAYNIVENDAVDTQAPKEVATVSNKEAEMYKKQAEDRIQETIKTLYPKISQDEIKRNIDRTKLNVLHFMKLEPNWEKLDFKTAEYMSFLQALETVENALKESITKQKVKEIENDESPF